MTLKNITLDISPSREPYHVRYHDIVCFQVLHAHSHMRFFGILRRSWSRLGVLCVCLRLGRVHHRRRFLDYLRRCSESLTAPTGAPAWLRLLLRVGLKRGVYRRRRFFGNLRRSWSRLAVLSVRLTLLFCLSLARKVHHHRRLLGHLRRFLGFLTAQTGFSVCLRLLLRVGLRWGVHRRRRFFAYLERSLTRRCMYFVCFFSMAQVISL